MKRITLAQILQYLSDDTPIQVQIEGQEVPEEFLADSVFLKPFHEYEVTGIEGTESFIDDFHILRVTITGDVFMTCYNANAA